MRAQLTAILLFGTNIVGLSVGPSGVAAITQFVFKDPARTSLLAGDRVDRGGNACNTRALVQLATILVACAQSCRGTSIEGDMTNIRTLRTNALTLQDR